MNSAVTQIINEASPKLEQFVKELNDLLDKYQYDIELTLDYRLNGVFPAIRMADVPPKEATAPVNNPEPTIDTPMETPVFPSQEGGVPNGQ
jgi:hypothetical protein